MNNKLRQQEAWDFWRPIVAPAGVLLRNRVKAELHDYLLLLDTLPRVYSDLSGGAISDPHTHPSVIQDYLDAFVAENADAAVLELVTEILDIIKSSEDAPSAVVDVTEHCVKIHRAISGA